MSGKVRLFVIEDDEVDALILRREVEQSGNDWQVVHETDASDFLARCESDADEMDGNPLILLDLSMPGMDGFNFLEARKKVNPLKRVPVIMTTSSDSVDDISTALELGASDYFVKSMRHGQYQLLIRKIERQLEALPA